MTKVKFLIEKPEGELPCNVFAFFPELLHNGVERQMFVSYAHIGQHSACHIDYANECTEASPMEYRSLLIELIGQGYNDLQIVNNHTIQCHRQPTKEEIKRGYGAVHFRDFPLSVIGLKKGKAMWKDWFKAPDDGLRYYTK
jgi:hypothetical protein